MKRPTLGAAADSSSLSAEDFNGSSFAFSSTGGGASTPSRFLSSMDSNSASPNISSAWSSGMTPSIFGMGSTPSGGATFRESNPFEMSFTEGGSASGMTAGDETPALLRGDLDEGSNSKMARGAPTVETPGGSRWSLGEHGLVKRSRRSVPDESSNSMHQPPSSIMSTTSYSHSHSHSLGGTPIDPSLLGSSAPPPSDALSNRPLCSGPSPSSFANNSLQGVSPSAFSQPSTSNIYPPPITSNTSYTYSGPRQSGAPQSGQAATHPTYPTYAYQPSPPSQRQVHPSQQFAPRNTRTSAQPPQVVAAMRANLDQLSSSASTSELNPPAQTNGRTRKGKASADQGEQMEGEAEPEMNSFSGLGEGTIEEREEIQRKVFLERNRLAASKSRMKKKERVGDLEHMANQVSAQNVQLQTLALSLREQLLQLRTLATLHKGCSCEHVIGYFKREAKGGGLPTLDIMAGRTLQMDYTNVPKLGSDDDLFAKMLPLAELPADIAEAEAEEEARKKQVRKAAASLKRKQKKAAAEADEGGFTEGSLSPTTKW